MLDLRFIRENAEAVRQSCRARNVPLDVDRLLALDEARRRIQTELEGVRRRQNELSKSLRGRKPDDSERAEGKSLKEREAALESEAARTQEELRALHEQVPNLAHPDAPVGQGEAANAELRVVGKLPTFPFPPLDHVALCERHDLVDFEGGARVAGQKFYYLKNELVLLELALVRYALDYLRPHGFTLFQTPDVARPEVAAGLGFNPRGEGSQIYSIADHDLVLVGTAEITLGGLHRDEILEAEVLPLRYAGLSHCFRTEAGAAGQLGRGLYRVHQFTKVEMFVLCRPEESDAVHAELLAHEEAIHGPLEIPYRVVDVCTGDLGAPAARKFDLEAWMPGRGEGGSFGEITSTSNCTDYQARRLGTRYRDPGTGKPRFVHMLNGTAITTRVMIALLENHQRADGSIAIPARLRPYTGFDRIG